MTPDNSTPKGSGQIVEDFSTFCEGDVDPSLNKKIRELIDSQDDYLIYLDDDLQAEWTWTDSYNEGKDPPGFAEIANRIAHLETLSGTQFKGEDQRKLFERLLAEGMARGVGDKDEKKAQETLDKAEAYLRARGSENARIWYLTGAAIIASISIMIAGILWIAKGYAVARVGNGFFEVFLGMCIGGPGAFLSILFRFEKITIAPAAGSRVHHYEGGARTLAGNLGGLLVALAIKGNLALGILKGSNYQLAAVLALCLVAGTSERFVRGFIKKMETPSQE
jgi:hypothetical protein